ncbi:hypothetical protein LCGC14_0887640 [marine sediment metagenome]|uniref:Malectin domain-containing protein n=1 Tax=marine sediment metagenome TaxID=412755 RepID=A0A0F9P054_9ZZZZ
MYGSNINGAHEAYVDQTQRWNRGTATPIRGSGSTQFPGTELFPSSRYQFQYFLEELATTDTTEVFLYAIRGVEKESATGLFPTWGNDIIQTQVDVYMHKIHISDAVATPVVREGSHRIALALQPGKPEKYQGLWYFPMGNDTKHLELTVIGTGVVSGDTLTGLATSFAPGADHLGKLGHQMISVVQNGTNGGGARILAEDGNPLTASDWGPVFQVGERNDRPRGVTALHGLMFVLQEDGLYSFNSSARTDLVWEDYRSWRGALSNINMSPFEGGLLLPHPAGLLDYKVGEEPEDFGIPDIGTSGTPASGVTELHGGRYHSTFVVGKKVYKIYQPNLTSTTVLVMVGIPNPEGGRPFWHVLGTSTLNIATNMLACHVTTLSTDVAPTLWFGNAGDINYVTLDPQASPFRARGDTHKVNLAADAYMSELRFTEPVDLEEIVVQTSADMATGDEFQISLLTNGTGNDIKVGAPIRGSGVRHTFKLDRAKGGKKVTSLVLRVNWAATSTSARVPPAIQSIELFGQPSIGEVQE